MSLASPAVPGSAVPPVDHAAHHRLVQALLRAGGPADGGPSYALLWQYAAAEQQRAGRAPQEVEQSLELLVTEILALAHIAPWFATDPRLAAACTEETIAFWTGTTQVPSRDAHLAWHDCWELRAAVVGNPPLAAADVVDAVDTERRLRAEWEAQWQAWSQRSTLATAD